MTTILKEISISGNGLMKNKPCTVNFFPSKTGKIRYFVKGGEPFEACVDNVLSTEHCVVLGNKKSRAMLTEHLTAALAFCGIDSIDICMDEMEVPALDGSSKKWVELFEKAGIEKHLFEKNKYYTVSEPVYYLNGKTSLVILPDKELYISYAVNYDHPDLNEPIKHKILDLIGDLYLTGINPLNLKCQILVKEAGHAVHIKTAKMLKDKLIECK